MREVVSGKGGEKGRRGGGEEGRRGEGEKGRRGEGEKGRRGEGEKGREKDLTDCKGWGTDGGGRKVKRQANLSCISSTSYSEAYI